MALEMSELVYYADPQNSDALVLALASADIVGNADRFERLLKAVPAQSKLAAQRTKPVLIGLIDRRTGLADRK